MNRLLSLHVSPDFYGLSSSKSLDQIGFAQVDGRDLADDADIETSSAAYAARFASVAGELVLQRQTAAILRAVSGYPKARVLDVGGGHGQVVRPLVARGHEVTVVGSADSCSGRIEDLIKEKHCQFLSCNLLELPFAEQSFDVVMVMRFFSHCLSWQKLVGELCRVSRSLIVFDFAPLWSANIFYPLLFSLKKRREGNTRQFNVFKGGELRQEFNNCGFVEKSRDPQFFLPIVVHRVIEQARVSQFLEGAAWRLGLTSLLGSPVIQVMQRRD